MMILFYFHNDDNELARQLLSCCHSDRDLTRCKYGSVLHCWYLKRGDINIGFKYIFLNIVTDLVTEKFT